MFNQVYKDTAKTIRRIENLSPSDEYEFSSSRHYNWGMMIIFYNPKDGKDKIISYSIYLKSQGDGSLLSDEDWIKISNNHLKELNELIDKLYLMEIGILWKTF